MKASKALSVVKRGRGVGGGDAKDTDGDGDGDDDDDDDKKVVAGGLHRNLLPWRPPLMILTLTLALSLTPSPILNSALTPFKTNDTYQN